MTITGAFEHIQYFTLKQVFSKAKTYFDKLKYHFLVESTTIENAAFIFGLSKCSDK